MLYAIFTVLFAALYGHSEGRPNIIVILADDLGWNDLSFHGSPQIPTPNLDSLAVDGVILNNYYVTPLCSPSRGALMTGLYPIHIGLQHDVIYTYEPRGLPLNHTLLPEYLRTLGYTTHAVGKWHLGFFRKEYTPTYRGFDSHFGYWGGKEDYYDHTQQMGEMWGLDFHHNMQSITDMVGQYSTELFADEAAKIILKHNASKPLFLYVAYQAVHSANSYDTLQAPPKYVKRFPHIQDKNRKIFAGMVSAMDDSVKVIIDALKKNNMFNNSIILFSTDNGGPAAGFNDNAASNWPLRGVKGTLWEGGVRGISFIWSPLLKKPHRTSMDLIHITDWLPTLYYAAGGNPLDLGVLDGYNVWETLSNGVPSPRSEVLLNIDPINKVSALRVGNYKVIQGTVYDGKWDSWYGPSGRKNSTLVNEWKVKFSRLSEVNSELLCGDVPKNATPCFPATEPCLFDVSVDPCEINNLAAEKPQVLNKLLQMISIYAKSAIPPGNKPADPKSDPKYHNYQWINWKDYI